MNQYIKQYKNLGDIIRRGNEIIDEYKQGATNDEIEAAIVYYTQDFFDQYKMIDDNVENEILIEINKVLKGYENHLANDRTMWDIKRGISYIFAMFENQKLIKKHERI